MHVTITDGSPVLHTESVNKRHKERFIIISWTSHVHMDMEENDHLPDILVTLFWTIIFGRLP